MKIFITLFIGCLSFHIEAQNSYTEIPINLQGNLIYIPLKINGSKPLNFLFDTGAEVTVLDDAIAEKLELNITDTAIIGTSAKSLVSQTSTSNTIHIGDIQLDSQSIEVLSIKHLSDRLKIQIDGIIGYEILKKYIVTTDLDQMKFIINDTIKNHHQTNTLQINKIDLENHHFGLPIEIKFRKNSEPVILSFKYDTGFPGNLIFHNPTVNKYSMEKMRRVRKSKGTSVDNSITTNLKSKVYQVKLPGSAWKNVPVGLDVDPLSVQAFEKSKAAGLVGNAILNR
ncbi:MAG: clan AA aspartic protease, partial [Saprospiraceae bacterium]|nr:clan AA aspartic protease [Saprospiraceae bacterium]